MIACPWSLSLRLGERHPEHTIAISCVPPDKNPPCCTSSTLITAGLYCSRKGIENRSFTFSTTIPIVCCWPTFSARLRGSNRICAAFVAAGTVVAAPRELGAVEGAPGEGGTVAAPGACCPDGAAVGCAPPRGSEFGER